MINNTILAIETDERQHRSYDQKDEEIRYDDLYMVFSGKWIFIRFNPDSYLLNGIRKNTLMEVRLQKLGDEILHQIDRIKRGDNKDLLEIKWLYYNS